jgi:hypothetical protein
MRCVCCLSGEARCRWPRGGEWFWIPLALPLHCNRCLSNFYLPTLYLAIAIPLGRLVSQLLGDE